MKKPKNLIELIEELKEEPKEGHIRLTSKESHAVIRLEGDEEQDDVEGSFLLTDNECELLLCSAGRVDQFYDAIGCPPDASIEFHGLELEQDVLTVLEKLFIAVDEM